MGAGIFIRYSKQVMGGALALLALLAAAGLYIHFRSPVGGVSPYETVNNLYGQEWISLTAQQDVYPADVETVQLTIRNDAEDTVVGPAPYCPDDWLLEIRVDGVWHSVRRGPFTAEEHVKWEFPPEEYGPNSGPLRRGEVGRRRTAVSLPGRGVLPDAAAAGAVPDRVSADGTSKCRGAGGRV